MKHLLCFTLFLLTIINCSFSQQCKIFIKGTSKYFIEPENDQEDCEDDKEDYYYTWSGSYLNDKLNWEGTLKTYDKEDNSLVESENVVFQNGLRNGFSKTISETRHHRKEEKTVYYVNGILTGNETVFTYPIDKEDLFYTKMDYNFKTSEFEYSFYVKINNYSTYDIHTFIGKFKLGEMKFVGTQYISNSNNLRKRKWKEGEFKIDNDKLYKDKYDLVSFKLFPVGYMSIPQQISGSQFFINGIVVKSNFFWNGEVPFGYAYVYFPNGDYINIPSFRNLTSISSTGTYYWADGRKYVGEIDDNFSITKKGYFYNKEGNSKYGEFPIVKTNDNNDALMGLALLGFAAWGINKLFSNENAQASSSNSNNSYSNGRNLYVISIGISNYTDNSCINDLTYADADANEIANRLKQGDGNSNLFDHVFTSTLTNSNATKRNIQDILKWARNNADEKDVIIIQVSSHGGINPNNGKLLLTPSDFNCRYPSESSISLDDIIYGINCQDCATLIWLDACHAGQAGNDFKNKLDEYLKRKQGQNVNLLVSSSNTESSLESSNWQHGAFSKSIIDGLNGDADQNNNRIISLRELTEYVLRKVQTLTQYKQNPQNPIKFFENTRLSTY